MEERHSLTNGAGIINVHLQKYDLCYILANCQMNELKWILDLNVKLRSIKLLEGKIREYLWDLELGKGFLVMTPKASCRKEKTELIGLH